MLVDDVTRPTAAGGRLRRFLAAIAGPLAEWSTRYRERCALARLDDYLLRDIGLTRAEARREMNKPFWKP